MFHQLHTAIRAPYFSDHKLHRHRLDLLRQQIQFCAEQVPYYSRLFRKIGLTAKHVTNLSILNEIPTLSKDRIRDNYGDFLGRGLDIPRLRKDHTSGSTGQPFWTYYDRLSWFRKKYVSKLRARVLCGFRPGERILKLECEPSASDDGVHSLPVSASKLMRSQTYSIFDEADRVANAMVRFKPRHIYGYPSYLFRLARYVDVNKYSFPYLKRIFTSSEYLSDNVRRYISTSFRTEVHDIYGCNEFKEVAWQCRPDSGYHVNEDEIIFEILDDKERPAADGAPGQIVITDLLNRAMPLIRYRMKDWGVKLSAKCQCGCPFGLMKPLAGRASDDIVLPNGRTLSPYEITTSIEKVRGLRQYQIVQESPDVLRASLNIDDAMEAYASRQIADTLRDLTDGLVEIKIELRHNIQIEDNGKFRVIKNDCTRGRLPSC